jgi:hypothetical protein
MHANSILTLKQMCVLPRAEDQVLRQPAMSLLRKEKYTVHFSGQRTKEDVFGDVSESTAGDGILLPE